MNKPKRHINAQLLYVIAIAWWVAAISCYFRQVGAMTIIFAVMGLIHLVWAIVADTREGRNER